MLVEQCNLDEGGRAMKAHKMTIILALLFVFGLLAIDSVRARHQDVPTASLSIEVNTT